MKQNTASSERHGWILQHEAVRHFLGAKSADSAFCTLSVFGSEGHLLAQSNNSFGIDDTSQRICDLLGEEEGCFLREGRKIESEDTHIFSASLVLAAAEKLRKRRNGKSTLVDNILSSSSQSAGSMTVKLTPIFGKTVTDANRGCVKKVCPDPKANALAHVCNMQGREMQNLWMSDANFSWKVTHLLLRTGGSGDSNR